MSGDRRWRYWSSDLLDILWSSVELDTVLQISVLARCVYVTTCRLVDIYLSRKPSGAPRIGSMSVATGKGAGCGDDGCPSPSISSSSSLAEVTDDLDRDQKQDEKKKLPCLAIAVGSAESFPATQHGPSAVGPELGPAASRVPPRPLIVVPRAQRRGLFGRFTLVPEVDRPYDYDKATKWGITATVSFAAVAAALGSSIVYPALPVLSKDLDTTLTVTNFSVAMYMLSMSIFPLWWSSFSEQFGRRSIYLISFSLFIIFSIVCAVSGNISVLIVFSILTGGASASVQTVGAGTIADIWDMHERRRAMNTFYLGPLLGPLVAPILGGVLAQELGWRASMYGLAIYGSLLLGLLLFLLPETLARPKVEEPALVSSQLPPTTTESAGSFKAKTRRWAAGVKRVLFDPLAVLLFLRFPPVLITVFIASMAFFALFIVNVSIQQKFSEPPYNYKQLVVGALYAPPSLGLFLTSLLGGQWTDKIMAREAHKVNRYDDKGRLIMLPKDRMRENVWLANTFYPLGLLLFGWALEYGLFWLVPSIRAFIFGASSMLVFSATTTMLTEFVRRCSSAGVAVNNFVRNILSCVGVVITAPWVKAVGTGWIFTTLGPFCLLTGFLGIWTLRRNAQRWRKEMDEVLKQM